MNFPFNEQVDIILNHIIFAPIERRLRETGTLKLVRNNAGRPLLARTPIAEDAVLQRIDDYPETSTRTLQREIRIPKSTVSRIFRDQLLRLFYI
ncbi:hypothetical protein RN001_010177 [Aquatica leii]|uniref:Uncharacterized protein n=1 Tax=Aquatica leii TaxID=1421715 RepID=A0AAN7P9L4_9COLE|nr:hypothetical protein RN001_010177 [Aquatica leii]